MAESLDLDKMEKLPAGCRFFDINEWWYFPNRWAVRLLYPLPVSANQITLLALVMGLVAAAFYFSQVDDALVWGALFLYGKLFLDNVDGNLARLRGEASRLGRFLDSFSDCVVAALVYAGIAWRLAQGSAEAGYFWVLAAMALLGSWLQCSYWVFYYVSYTEWVGSYGQNRTDETVTEQDRQAATDGEISAAVYFLQRFHNIAYGWQDALIAGLDRLSRKAARVSDTPEHRERWLGDRVFLAWMGPLCVCTHTFVLVVCSLFNQLELFLYLVIFLGNGYLLALQIWKIRRFRRRISQ